ncbi:cyclase family protein [Dactylosporangium sp. NPDC051484]|uniref:cyclase family protein n=1 Tax=Dactylosporangium sp. NPDC051484 TaxID=3154942 RepID=UPI0034510C1A
MQRRHLLAAAGGAVAGAAGLAGTASAAPAGGAALRPGKTRLISLSHVNDPAKTNIYPGDPEFTLETIATIENEGYYLQYVREGEATGTHWGAPGHFNAGEPLADELDPNDLFLPAVKIDVRDKCARNADYALTVNDVKQWERCHGRIPDESMIIMWTGWEYKWGTPAFPNLDADGVLHQPGFAPETVQWFIDTGRIGHNGGTGIDTFGPDLGTDPEYRASLLVYRRHRVSLEILAGLARFPATGGSVLCGGFINHKGSGSTALIFGVIPPGVRV